jgi:hypothetical protein
MTVTAASFRVDFPEFSDTTKYPDAAVTFWLTYALTLLNAQRFCEMLDYATEFFIAHELTLGYRNRPGYTGLVMAPQASKTVDKVSVSYDTSSVKLENAGHWGGTSYGLQLLGLMRMFGAGPIQL